jgi:hypothetical protein
VSEVIKVAILGAGSVRCTPPVISSLGTYFGERPLEVRLYDADEERLDLMDRLARHCFRMTEATHTVLYRPDYKEALEEVDRIVLQVGRNCARKFQKVKFPGNLKQEDAMISKTLATMLESAPAEADVLSLERKTVSIPTSFYRRMDWPGEPTDEQLRWMPHQILRWIKAEEQIYEFLKEQEDSPFKAWLDDPNAADLVVNRSNEG